MPSSISNKRSNKIQTIFLRSVPAFVWKEILRKKITIGKNTRRQLWILIFEYTTDFYFFSYTFENV